MGGFVITCRRHGDTLFMVDRKKQRKSFWSDRLDDVLVWKDEKAAQRHADTLKFNDPQVIPLEKAERIDLDRMKARLDWQRIAEHSEACSDMEMGWDGHKVWA